MVYYHFQLSDFPLNSSFGLKVIPRSGKINNESNSLSTSPSALFIYYFPLIFPVLTGGGGGGGLSQTSASSCPLEPISHALAHLSCNLMSQPRSLKTVTQQDTAVIGTIREPGVLTQITPEIPHSSGGS